MLRSVWSSLFIKVSLDTQDHRSQIIGIDIGNMPANKSPDNPVTANEQLANKPRTRQRVQKAPPPLNVPDINDDATERKRVLNVLAQRRYSEYPSYNQNFVLGD